MNVSDTKNSAVPHTTLHDLSGLGLIILGALFLTSAVLYVKGGPVENAGQYTLFMTGCIETFGASAIIWICLGLVFVGGRLFLFGGERGLIRDAAGFCATGLGLSILLGGFSPVHGGGFGRASGGAASALVGYYANSIAHLLGPFESAVRRRDSLPALEMFR